MDAVGAVGVFRLRVTADVLLAVSWWARGCFLWPGTRRPAGWARSGFPVQACLPRGSPSPFHCCLWTAWGPKGCALCPVGTQVCTEVSPSEEQVVSYSHLGCCVCVLLFRTVNNGCLPLPPAGRSLCLWAHSVRPGSQRGWPECTRSRAALVGRLRGGRGSRSTAASSR